MWQRLTWVGVLTLVAAAFIATGTAWAQSSTTSSIAGLVKDATGAVLPGVTVEASSPALIEKVRSVVTDEQGNYKIVDLRPGVYTVTFSLAGFGTLRRENVELVTGATTTVHADMKVGSIEETITVTGASPVVDTQNSRTQQVLRNEDLNALPSGTKSLMQFAAMTLGAMPSRVGFNDVGGDKGEQASGIVLHGGRGDDGRTNFDGMYTNMIGGDGGGMRRVYYFNTVGVQEVVVDTGGNSAEVETGGANVNLVPKDGGNVLSVYGLLTYTNSDFASKAVPDEILARGVGPQPSVKEIYDYGFGVGGPLRKDKLWFYTPHRWWGSQQYGTNNYFNMSTNPYMYVPDLSRPAYADTWFRDNAIRLTWQAAQKHKINQEEHLQYGCACALSVGSGALDSPEASGSNEYGPQMLSQTTWNYTATARLLLQAGASFLIQQTDFSTDGTVPGPDNFNIIDVGTGRQWGARVGGLLSYAFGTDVSSYNQKASVSYVTGSHAFRAGIQLFQGVYDILGMDIPNKVTYTFRNGAPISLTQWAAPFTTSVRARSQGVYVQDQWTVKRLTLNVGARFDRFEAHTRPLTVPAGPFTAERRVPGVEGLPDYKDIVPRVGAAYDVFGNGRTAIKGAFGRYLYGQGGGRSIALSPSLSIVQSVNRTWNDPNGDFVPDCVLTNPATNGECGPISNVLFGQPVTTLTLADDARTGWGVRAYNNQMSVQVQQQLWPGAGVAVGYFRTDWNNHTVTQNTAVTAADFTSYCITAPADSRLGDTSGQSVCGLYNINPAAFGRSNSVITRASEFGDHEEVFNGVDAAINARWSKGALVNGGITFGRTIVDTCYANSRPDLLPEGQSATLPRNAAYCRIVTPIWSGIGSQIKMQVVYPLPGAINLAATFKSVPGIPKRANLVMTNAQVAPALGRNLAGCPAAGACTQTAVLELIPISSNGGDAASSTPSGTVFDDRLNQTDVRISRTFRIGKARVQGILDVYNLLNTRVAQAIVTTYGPTWNQPTSLLGSRLFKLGVQIDY